MPQTPPPPTSAPDAAWPPDTGPELAFVARMWADDGCSRGLGMRVVEVSLHPGANGSRPLGSATLTMTVTESMVNGHDIAHGGFIFTLCDSAFAVACNAHGHLTVAASCDIDFVAPARLGDELVARAAESAGYGRNGITEVTVHRATDEALIAVFRGRSRTLTRPNPGS
ncbi:acyl-CoA thioesterase [Kineosphaera limosa]|uniref:Thioesterase PaaD n=1 Tax=Kineosphaera limosa NBRC 100340 TaxID=1184609 RepID=K6WBR6_9MICO|nr:hydroxyphenylacetyl-CoA thioesterase PaaI [Kineosphaera limosa]NYE01523.1 acyl-CoA thioesterase [Kineosphaera limosa]GAB96680.1 thioesterase PaaD [Kineosphaera limosa NBRC 100340]